jgi:hypothetical protein
MWHWRRYEAALRGAGRRRLDLLRDDEDRLGAREELGVDERRDGEEEEMAGGRALESGAAVGMGAAWESDAWARARRKMDTD